MWYLIDARDAPGSLERRLTARPAHVARLLKLNEQGRLLVAGPLPAIDAEDPGPAGFLGSVIIARFDSIEAARAWADEDPYVSAGVYQEVEVIPFKRVMPL